MGDNKILLLVLLIILFSVCSVLATEQSVIIKNGESRDLLVTCTYNGTFCDDSIYGNVTIIAPNGSIIVNNQPLTKINSVFSYTVTSTQTTINGDYLFVPTFYSDSVAFSDSLVFSVTPSGTEPSISEALVYGVLFFFVIAFMILIFLWAWNMDSRNSYKLDGTLIELNYGKYLKVFLYCVSYVSMLGLIFLTWQISLNILWLTFASNILSTFFEVMVKVTFPIFLTLMVLITSKWIYDDYRQLEFAKKGLRYPK